MNARSIRRLAAAGLALCAVLGAAGPASAAGSSPSPTPGVAGSGKSVSVPANNITFAIATSDGRTNDGRNQFALPAEPGQTLHDQVIVYNLGRVKAAFVLYPIDGVTAPDGSFTLAAITDVQKGFATWTRLARNYVVLPGGASVVVPFTVKVPRTANPGDEVGGIVVSSIPNRPTAGSLQQQLSVATRIGLRAVVRVGGDLRAQVSVENLTTSFAPTLTSPGFGALTVQYDVVNTGNVRVAADQTVRVHALVGGDVAGSTPARLASLLPGARVHVAQSYSGVFAGIRLTTTVTATPVVLEGTVAPGPAGVATDTTWAVSWILLLVIAVLMGLAVLLVLRLRRRGASGPGGGSPPSGRHGAAGDRSASTPVGAGVRS